MAGRRLLASLVASLLVLAACTDQQDVDVGAAEDVDREATLIAAVGGEPDGLDPHLTTSYASLQVLENVYDTLVQPSDDLTMEPALATAWAVSADNLTWTFRLREGVTWHNGRELVADDVVYSYERIMDPETGSPHAHRLAPVRSVTAPEDALVVIQLTRPAADLLADIGGSKAMAIVPREIVEDGSIDARPVGTGPFRFVSQEQGGEVVVERNDDYWQEGLPLLGGIRFRPVSDPVAKLTGLQTGELDWADGVPPQRLPGVEDSEALDVEAVPGVDYWHLAMNLDRAPFNTVQARRAIALALDRTAIAEAVRSGAATPNQTAIPQGTFFHFDHAPFEPQDQQVRDLLHEVGADGGFTMDLIVTGEHPETVAAAEVIATQLAPFGIDVQIRELDRDTWLDEQAAGNFDAFLLGWLGNIDPDDFYYAPHRTGSSFNFQGYSNDQVDRLLEQGRLVNDPDDRRRIYDAAAQIIVDEVSHLYLYNPHVIHAWASRVEGYRTRPDGTARFLRTSLGT